MKPEHAIPCTQADNIENLKESYSDIKEDVKAINKTLNGNGDGIGLKSNVLLLLDRTRGLKEYLEKEEKRQDSKEKKGLTKIQLWLIAIGIIASAFFSIMAFAKEYSYDREWKQKTREGQLRDTGQTRGIHAPMLSDTLKDTIK